MAVSKVTLNGSTLMDTTGVTVDESNLLTGNTALDNSGTLITGTATAENDFIVTLSYNDQTEMWEPDCTFAELQAAFTAEKMVSAIVDGDNLGEAATVSWDSQLQEAYIIVYYWKDLSVEEWCMINANYYWNANDGYVLNNEENLPRITFETISKTYTPTLSQQTETIVPDSSLGYNGIDQVNITVNAMPSGTAGTPTATKGSVSNNSISVTPSVTNTTGYITGSTISGTAVTVSASELDSGTKSITENGTGIDVVGYAAVDVAVPAAARYTAKITGSVDPDFFYVRYNGTDYKTSGAEFTFSPSDTCSIFVGTFDVTGTANLYVDGVLVDTGSWVIYTYTFASHSIEINCQMSSMYLSNVYITPPTLEITSNGEYDVTDYAVADVDLPAGTEGTPVATKGTVSNHAISVTPSVTNTAGVITGGTHTGTAVTVDVTELESGTKTITENGTGISVSGYSAVDVNVSAGGGVTVESLSVTQNGTYTAPTGKAYTPVTVNVSGGSGGAISITDVVDPVTGGTARYINAVDISDTTAVAADVAQGKYFYTAAGVKTAGAASGGGGSSTKALNFIDYDGTIVNSYTAQEAQALSSLPDNPSHTGLTAQGWNWSLANIKSYLTNHSDGIVNVGQMYITQSGATEIDVTFDDANFLSPWLAIAPNGTVVVDWGDGSSTDTVTGTDLTTLVYTQHVYAQTGSYTIKLTVSSGTLGFYNSNANYASVLRTTNADSNRACNRTYSGCITAIRLGGSVSVGYYAFRNCHSLTSITIPDGVTVIDTSAFNSCYSLLSITIPDGVTNISDYAFQHCYSLTSITIPDTVTSISEYAFRYCYALASLTIPDTVTSISQYAFAYCYSLTSLTIPDTVTSISIYAFNGCYSLTSLTIPDTVKSIGNYAFYNCYSLTSLTIPDGVTSINQYVFYNCYSLTSLTIPDRVTNIGSNAFYGCCSLTSLTIPDRVTSINGSAFYGCYAMEEYHFQRTTPPTLGSSAFYGIMSGTKIYVPYSADHSVLNAYKTASNWSTYASYMEEEPN